MNYYDEQQAGIQRQMEENRILAQWIKFLRRPENAGIRDSDAVFQWFKNAFTDLKQFDADACQLLMDNPEFVKGIQGSITTPALNKQQQLERDLEIRSELIEDILGLLTKAMSPAQIAERRKQYELGANWTVAALRQRYSELSQMKALERGYTVEQLRQIGRPQPLRPDEVPATLTRKAFAKMNSKEQRFAIQKYGHQALNTAWAEQEGREVSRY